MPDGRIDTRFQRLRSPRHDKLLRSILFHLLRHKDMVCARTFSSFDSPLQFRPFALRPSRPISKTRLLTQRRFAGGNPLGG
jgi:hypothetical protein